MSHDEAAMSRGDEGERVMTIWEHLGFADHEERTIKSDRLIALDKHLRARKLSTARAMRLLDATADEVGYMRRGRFGSLSHERVEQLHSRLPIASQAHKG